MISALLVAVDVVGSARGQSKGSDGTSLYFFFEGRWSLPSSLIFVVVVYHIRYYPLGLYNPTTAPASLPHPCSLKNPDSRATEKSSALQLYARASPQSRSRLDLTAGHATSAGRFDHAGVFRRTCLGEVDRPRVSTRVCRGRGAG